MCIYERVCVTEKTYSAAKGGAEDSAILGQDEDGLDLFEVPEPLESVVYKGGRGSGGGCGVCVCAGAGAGAGAGACGGHDGD